ncbi:SIR2 family protein [bacterium]|nr:SIR2 family protein [bacterium]
MKGASNTEKNILEDKKNKFAKMVQKYLEKQPVVILGTGATIPFGLPSMDEFAENLRSTIIDKTTEWINFLEELEKTNNLEQALQNVQLSQNLVGRVVAETWKLVNGKDLDFYKKIVKDTSGFFLKDLFLKLLQSHPKHLKIITTNYDRVAEYAADLADANIHTGFSGKYILNFNQNYLQNCSSQNRIDIWKVHGSLDWFNRQNSTSFSSPLAKEIPENSIPLIVTPGIEKYQRTHNEPYRTVMSKADEALEQAPCFLCIGYGFNDEHIQPKLIHQVQQKGKPIVAITKKISDNGKKILLNNQVKSIVLEEDDKSNKTRVHYFEDNRNNTDVLDGDIWQLNNFLNIWF